LIACCSEDTIHKDTPYSYPFVESIQGILKSSPLLFESFQSQKMIEGNFWCMVHH